MRVKYSFSTKDVMCLMKSSTIHPISHPGEGNKMYKEMFIVLKKFVPLNKN